MTSTVLWTVASGAEHPLLDIDYTIIIQLGIFLLTCLAASTLFFRPYLRLRERRHAGMEGAREDAVRMSAEADAKLVDYESKLAAARARAQDERHSIRAEAAKHLGEVTGNARRDAASAMEAARKQVETESEKARSELLPRADELGRQIASKLLGREVA